MASTITLSDSKAAEVALGELSRSHPKSPSLPGSLPSSPTRFGDATESSEGTAKGLCSDIEGAEPPPKKAREVKPGTRRRKPQQEEVSHSKKPAEVKPPPEESHSSQSSQSQAARAARSKATARRKPQQEVKQEEQSSQEDVEQENGQVKQGKTPSQSDDDTIDYDDVLIPTGDPIWLCKPGGKMKVGDTKDARLVEWLKFARRQYVAKMKSFNLVEDIVFMKDFKKAISTTNKSKFVNDMFTSKFMRTLTHTPSYIFSKICCQALKFLPDVAPTPPTSPLFLPNAISPLFQPNYIQNLNKNKAAALRQRILLLRQRILPLRQRILPLRQRKLPIHLTTTQKSLLVVAVERRRLLTRDTAQTSTG